MAREKKQVRGWLTVDSYIYPILIFSAIIALIAHLIAGEAGRALLYMQISYLTVVPIYAIKMIVELRGRHVVPRNKLLDKLLLSIFIPIFCAGIVILPWWLLVSGDGMIGRSHLVYLALTKSVISLAIVGAGLIYAAAFSAYLVLGALPLMWNNHNRS
ncbi:MAG: hypothetical protein NW204_14050 [Xanthomonadaceae bacterium]|nr:hypothetical protein [Xanthomonadaceae bacterium]